MGKDKEQIAFRVTPQMKREIDLIMDSDGSRTRNEFLEHAVRFYIDHLLAGSMTTLAHWQVLCAGCMAGGRLCCGVGVYLVND